MNDLGDLYQEVILDHYRSPRNFKVLPDVEHEAEGHNPLCGDRVEIYLRLEDEMVEEVGFQGDGCAISRASASIMTELLEGRTADEIEELVERFRAMVTGEDVPDADQMGKMAVFRSVSAYPVRVKCASLAWHTALAALRGEEETVRTE